MEIWRCFPVISQSNFPFIGIKSNMRGKISNLLFASYILHRWAEFISKIVKISSQHNAMPMTILHAIQKKNRHSKWECDRVREKKNRMNIFVWQIKDTYLRYELLLLCSIKVNSETQIESEACRGKGKPIRWIIKNR